MHQERSGFYDAPLKLSVRRLDDNQVALVERRGEREISVTAMPFETGLWLADELRAACAPLRAVGTRTVA